MSVEPVPSPDEERRAHQAAILGTIAPPTVEQVLSTNMVLPQEGANTFEGASEKRVELYKTYWSDALAHPVILVKRRRNKTYEIVDGRHRWLARRGKPFVFHALVFHDLEVVQEQALFWYFNDQRRSPSPDEKHKAGVFAGDPVARTIDEVLTLYGVRSQLRAVGTLHRIINRADSIEQGRDEIEFAIRSLRDCFPTAEKPYESVLLSGFARFYHLYPDLNYAVFVERIQAAGLVAAQVKATAVGEARTSGQGAEHKVVDQLVKAWNKSGAPRLRR